LHNQYLTKYFLAPMYLDKVTLERTIKSHMFAERQTKNHPRVQILSFTLAYAVGHYRSVKLQNV